MNFVRSLTKEIETKLDRKYRSFKYQKQTKTKEKNKKQIQSAEGSGEAAG